MFKYKNIKDKEWYETNDIKFFCGNENIKSVILSDDVEIIPKYMFYCCINMENITFNKKIKSIEDFAFHSCDKLKKITIPDSVTNIGNYAFSCCDKLIYVKLSENIEIIKHATFFECKNLKNVHFLKVKKIEFLAFALTKVENKKIKDYVDVHIHAFEYF